MKSILIASFLLLSFGFFSQENYSETDTIAFEEDRNYEEKEHKSNPQVDDRPDGEREASRGDVQLVEVAYVANCGLENGADPGPRPGEGIEDRGQHEGGHCHEDQGDVERGVRGRRYVAFCDIAPCL